MLGGGQVNEQKVEFVLILFRFLLPAFNDNAPAVDFAASVLGIFHLKVDLGERLKVPSAGQGNDRLADLQLVGRELRPIATVVDQQGIEDSGSILLGSFHSVEGITRKVDVNPTLGESGFEKA